MQLNASGPPLGYDIESKYTDKSFTIQSGDKFVFYSDGLIECRSPDGTQWGSKSLLEKILKLNNQTATETMTEIVNDALAHFADRSFDDDVTVAVVEVSPDWRPATNE